MQILTEIYGFSHNKNRKLRVLPLRIICVSGHARQTRGSPSSANGNTAPERCFADFSLPMYLPTGTLIIPYKLAFVSYRIKIYSDFFSGGATVHGPLIVCYEPGNTLWKHRSLYAGCLGSSVIQNVFPKTVLSQRLPQT